MLTQKVLVKRAVRNAKGQFTGQYKLSFTVPSFPSFSFSLKGLVFGLAQALIFALAYSN